MWTEILAFKWSGGGKGGGIPGEKELGGVREAGEEGAESEITMLAEKGRKRGKLRNIGQYFAIEKNAKKWEPTSTGRELRFLRVREAEGLNPPAPPPPQWKHVHVVTDKR